MIERAKKLLGILDDGAKRTLGIQLSATAKAQQAHHESGTAVTLKNMRANEEALLEWVEKYEAATLPKDPAKAAANGERFKNRAKAWAWMVGEGYPVAQRTFYNACETGEIAVHRDKSISKWQVLEYARKKFAPAGATPESVDLADQMAKDEARLLKAKADREEMRAEDERREQDRKWLHRDDAERALCARLAELRDAFRYHATRQVAAIVHIVTGDSSRVPELVELIETNIIARACNDVANSAGEETEIEFEEVAE